MSVADWPVEIDPIFGCLLWIGRVDKRDGSGIVWRGKQPIAAYIVVYDAEVGPVPEGLVRDHLCRRRACVAWWHIQLVTKDENERRKLWRYRVRITRCPKGHELKDTAIVTPQGGRVCRTCNQEALTGIGSS